MESESPLMQFEELRLQIIATSKVVDKLFADDYGDGKFQVRAALKEAFILAIRHKGFTE